MKIVLNFWAKSKKIFDVKKQTQTNHDWSHREWTSHLICFRIDWKTFLSRIFLAMGEIPSFPSFLDRLSLQSSTFIVWRSFLYTLKFNQIILGGFYITAILISAWGWGWGWSWSEIKLRLKLGWGSAEIYLQLSWGGIEMSWGRIKSKSGLS